MKRLSDYQNEEAIDLWSDLLDPISEILTDKEVHKVVKSGSAPIVIAKEILKRHKKEAEEILLRVDPEPLNGLNVVIRLVALLAEIGQRDDLKAFFGYAAQEKQQSESITSVMENTGVEEN